MSSPLIYANVLMAQGNYREAEKRLREAILQDPHDSQTYALLARCLEQMERHDEAETEARRAIELDPDDSFGFYVLAGISYRRNDYKQAEWAIRESIQRDPESAADRALLAAICINTQRWTEALAAAEQGLEFDPENDECINVRAMALVKLGRKSEADTLLRDTLARDPENAVTLANLGWNRLEHGDHQQALEHFRESLRLDPQDEWARKGIVTALKARHTIYRWMLAYALWSAKLRSSAQWGLALLPLFAQMGLRRMNQAFPEWSFILGPLLGLVVLFVVMTWLADPLFNLFLRFNRFGRLALSPAERSATNYLLLFLVIFLLLLVGANLFEPAPFLNAAIATGVLALPALGIPECEKGWPRRTAFAVFGLLAAATAWAFGTWIVLSFCNDKIFQQLPQPVAVLLGLSFTVSVLVLRIHWMLVLGVYLAISFLSNVQPRK